MPNPFAASIIERALGLELGASGEPAGNRCSLEGVTWKPGPDSAVELRIGKLEASAVRLASGAFVMELGRLAVHELVAQVVLDGDVPRLTAVAATEADFSGLKLHGPVVMPPTPPGTGAGAWTFGPLGEADGTIRGQITDAHLLFDAEVLVPIRHGQIDFNDATVEHVGPDSRMGVSRLGVYVDAPNGRSYLYQFASAPLAGVEYERRGALLGPWVSERGTLRLQPFAESLLRQGLGGGQGLTEQARLLMGRTALSGELQLTDGRIAGPGLQVQVEGRAEGHNAIGLRSEAVGRGLTVEMPSMSARDAVAMWHGARLGFGGIKATLRIQIVVEGSDMSFVLDLESGKIAEPRLALR